MPWAVLVQIFEPYYPKAKTGRPPIGIRAVPHTHYLQQWFRLSDPAMEEALEDVQMYRDFAKLDGATARLHDETTIVRFRHLLERHDLAVDMLRVACSSRPAPLLAIATFPSHLFQCVFESKGINGSVLWRRKCGLFDGEGRSLRKSNEPARSLPFGTEACGL